MPLWLSVLATTSTAALTSVPVADLLERLHEPLSCIGTYVDHALEAANPHAIGSQIGDSVDAFYADPLSERHASQGYHLTLTTANAGSTVPIPEDVLTTLCGDGDGCELRLQMTRWLDSGSTAAIGQESGRLHYDTQSGRWQLDERRGTDGDGTAEQIISARASTSAWDVCYLTDGTYLKHVSTGDNRGLAVLFWSGYADVRHTCELSVID
jgi:hypothetical protein